MIEAGSEKTRAAEAEQARALARKLCADALGWAKTFLLSVNSAGTALPARKNAGPPELEDELLREIVAYGLCLLEMRLEPEQGSERERFLVRVKQECLTIREGKTWRRRNRRRRLPAPGGESSSLPACGGQHSSGQAGAAYQGRLTREAFEQFCQSTGLSSDVLVGNGENLASLVFYIAVHGVCSANGLLSREQVLRLLRVAQECRVQLDKALGEWMTQQGGKRLIGDGGTACVKRDA